MRILALDIGSTCRKATKIVHAAIHRGTPWIASIYHKNRRNDPTRGMRAVQATVRRILVLEAVRPHQSLGSHPPDSQNGTRPRTISWDHEPRARPKRSLKPTTSAATPVTQPNGSVHPSPLRRLHGRLRWPGRSDRA